VGIVTAGTPLFSQLLKAGEIRRVRETVLFLTRYCLGGLIVAFGVLAIWGREILSIWLGPGHFVGYATLLVLMLLMLAEAHQGMFQSACVAAEKLGFYKAVLVGGLLSLGLSLVLIPRYGLLGAATASLVGQAATQHWITPWLAMRTLHMRFTDDVVRVLLPVASLGGAVALIGLLCKSVGGSSVPAFTATCVLSVLAGSLFCRTLVTALLAKVRSLRA
jgi:O-antigen/teichoic acid export membrane protein